jgi:RNA polymerase sigma factor (sigma-70 family)
MKKRFFIISLFWVLAIAAFGAIVMLLWNFVVPGVLGWQHQFLASFGIIRIARIFFGGFPGRGAFPAEEECPVVKRVTRSALNGRRCLRKNARISLIKERSSDSVALSEETDSSTRETLIETTVAKLPKRMNNLTGKGNSLEELIVEHQPRLKAFIRKRVSSKEDAEDILQDVLYQLVKTIESTFNPIEQVTAWLYRVARNTIINKGKKMQEEELPDSSYDKEDNVLSEFSDVLFCDAPPTPEVEYMRSLVWQELETALAELPPEQREAFELLEMEGLSVKKLPVLRDISQHFIITKTLCRHPPSRTVERDCIATF